MTTESMVDDRTFNLLMDLPYTKPVKITGKNPNEYFGYGYLTPDAGMQAAMGNTVRVLGQEFTNPRQGVQDDEIIQNRYRNKWGNIK
jgi:hypothetical protein